MAGAGFRTITAALLGTLAACGDGDDKAPPPAAPPLAVAVTRVGAAEGARDLVVSGIVRLKRETPLAFNTPGRIAAITVREGDRVGAGQLLARLDPVTLDASVASARAEVTRAEADHARARGLFEKGWVTAPRVETARAAAESARARLRQAGFDRGLATLTAPTAGVILTRPAEPGQIVQPGQTVLSIGEYASGHVLRLPMADADMARVRVGQPAVVRLPALGGASLPGVVSEIGARGDDATGTFRVEVRLPADPRLRSGLIGEARLALPEGDVGPARLAVPVTAVFSARADEGFVYVLPPGSQAVRLRQVALGNVGDRVVVVTAGLKPGETVVTTGVDRLRDGMRVTVRPAA